MSEEEDDDDLKRKLISTRQSETDFVIWFILAEFKDSKFWIFTVMGMLFVNFVSSAKCIVKCRLSLSKPRRLIEDMSTRVMSKEMFSLPLSTDLSDTLYIGEEVSFSVTRAIFRIFEET